MAITRAQIARELYIKGGVVNPDGRRGFGGGATSGSKERGYQGGGRDKKGSVKGAAPGAATVGPGEKGGGDGPKSPPSVISSPPKKPKVTTKTKDKNTRTRKISNFLKSIYDSRKKGIYNIVPNNPKRELEFLSSLQITDPAKYNSLPQDLKDLLDDTRIGLDKIADDGSFKDAPKFSYDDFKSLTEFDDGAFATYARDRGSPGLSVSGDMSQVGDKFVKRDPITGDPIKDMFGNTLFDYAPVREGGGRDDFILPVSQPVASIPEPTGYVNPLSLLTPRIAGTRFLGTELEDEEDTEFAANGGRIGAMGGGIMNTDVMGGLADGGMDESGRQMYFLGKLVKKATRAVKKLAKSPIGKAALAFGAYKLGSGFLKNKGIMSSLFGEYGGTSRMTDGLLGKLGITGGGGSKALTGLGKGVLYAGVPAAIAALTTPEEDDEFDVDAYYAANQLTPGTTKRQMGSEFDFYNYNLADGGMPSKEPVAKETMPLIDMEGKEMDLRAEGGFVPIGRMERADDVPARLSKNEFVFTADAVRNAGEGDIDKGAEVMYNMMKNLESGGEVSEESQGLDGAREMFQTSKRLEEVL